MEETAASLHLEDGDHPRKLLKLEDDEWIAWGGETGAVAWKDQLVRHWDDDDDIRAVAVHGKQVALGFDSGDVFVYRYEESVKEFLTKKASNMIVGPGLAASVRDVKFYNESNLVIASEDGLVVWNIETNEQWLSDEAKKHHDGSGIRSVAIRNSLLVSLAMDGRWCLWDLKERSLIHRGDICITRKDVGDMMGADAWDRSCRPLFLSKTSVLLPGAAWPQLRLLTPSVKSFDNTEVKGHDEAIVAAASRKNFAITVGRDKRVVLWSINTKLEPKLIRILKELESAATDIVWETNGTLRLACANGTMVVLPSVDLPKENVTEKPKEQANASKPEDKGSSRVPSEANLTASAAPPRQMSPKRSVTFADQTDVVLDKADAKDSPFNAVAASSASGESKSVDVDSDDEDIFDKATSTKNPNPFVDDEADDDEDDEIHRNSTILSTGIHRSEDDVVDNDEYGMDTYESEDLAIDDDLIRDHRTVQSLPDLQPPFAPSASPLDLERRFLCWNHIGSAIARQDDGRCMVDIHFTDAGFRRPITMNNSQGFILGSLGEEGGIFCTDLNEDDEEDAHESDEDNAVVKTFSASTREAVKRSKKIVDPNKPTGSAIYFHRYESFASHRDKDWRLVLPTGERALGCATGTGWVAVMTSNRYLRTFTTGGNQGQIYWLPGDPVTIAGRDGMVAVVFHQGQPQQDGSQCLGYMLVDILANNVVSRGPLSCLSKSSTLTWVGLSNDQSVMAMDSNGIVSMLVKCNTCFEWMPMLDTMGLRKSRDDSFWPITVFEGKLVCVPLKGGNSSPDAARRPVTTALGLRIPLAKAMIAKTAALEELSVRANLALSQKKSHHEQSFGNAEDEEFEREFIAVTAQVDKVTLKMFAANIEAGKLERGLDLVNRLHLERSYDIAMTLASSHSKLVDLIEEAKGGKFAQEYASVGDDDGNETSISDGRQITPETADKRRRENGEHDRNVRMRFGNRKM